MKLNLIFSNQNSLIDAQLIELQLKNISEKNVVQYVNSVHYQSPQTDVNIFFDSINFNLLRKANYNIFIPNLNIISKHESEFLPFFDLILVKTKYAYDVFKSEHFDLLS